MHRLYVLYDRRCDFCRRCRAWLEEQPKYIDLVFVPAGSNAAKERFPDLRDADRIDELVVIDDQGGVYRGSRAFIMCLYALYDYRDWSETLSSPAMFPLAGRFFDFLSRNRGWFSRWLGRFEDNAIEGLAPGRAQPPPPAPVYISEIIDRDIVIQRKVEKPRAP